MEYNKKHKAYSISRGMKNKEKAPVEKGEHLNRGRIPEKLVIRRLNSSDSIHELTELLHRVFKPDGQHSYAYPAAKQSEETTRMQTANGKCWVAELDGRLIGVGIVLPPPPVVQRRWYRPIRSASLRLLAVHPDFQRRGIGTILLDHCEQSAVRMNAWELTLSSPVGSLQISLYRRRGYNRIVEYASWPGTNYDSVVLAKCVQKGQKPPMINQVVPKIRFCWTFLSYKLRVLGWRKHVVMPKILQKLMFRRIRRASRESADG